MALGLRFTAFFPLNHARSGIASAGLEGDRFMISDRPDLLLVTATFPRLELPNFKPLS
jgi:hypothetical protein